MVVTRFVATGTVTTTVSSSVTRWMGSGGSASARAADNRRMLIDDFIFEVADGGREATLAAMLGLRMRRKLNLKLNAFGEHFFLKDAAADHLAGDGCQALRSARGENIHAGNFRFLMKLLGAKLDGFARTFGPALFACRF